MCYVWKIKINLDIYQFPPTEDREIDRYMQQLIDDDERWAMMMNEPSGFWLLTPESRINAVNQSRGRGRREGADEQSTNPFYLSSLYLLSSFNSTSNVLHAKTRSKKTTRGDQTLVMIRNSPDGLYSTWYSALGTQLNDGRGHNCTGTHWHTHLRKAITPNKIKIIIKIRKTKVEKEEKWLGWWMNNDDVF